MRFLRPAVMTHSELLSPSTHISRLTAERHPFVTAENAGPREQQSTVLQRSRDRKYLQCVAAFVESNRLPLHTDSFLFLANVTRVCVCLCVSVFRIREPVSPVSCLYADVLCMRCFYMTTSARLHRRRLGRHRITETAP